MWSYFPNRKDRYTVGKERKEKKKKRQQKTEFDAGHKKENNVRGR